jgi:hemoglobin
MTTTALCTEDEIVALVRAFYAKVRRDEVLGPVFERHVADWDIHLGRLADFWSSILLRTQRFAGAPMPKHNALPNLSAALFERWLALFAEATAAQPNGALEVRADAAAKRIAQSLWYGYQSSRDGRAGRSATSTREDTA